MDLKAALKYQLDDSGYQLTKVLEGLDGDQWDAKEREGLMSPRDVVAHLTECYIAAGKSMAGQEHEWGTYIPGDDDPEGLLATMNAERAKACDAMVASGDEKAVKAATAYVILHDAYHVGQLAALRLKLSPDWDAYSIYNG
jgi:hypothetical protein